jgi:C4-dicarboxylate transporter DctM subunit
MLIIVFAALILLLGLGFPIFVALGGLSMGLLLEHGTPPVVIAQLLVSKLNSGTIVAIPFFVMAAQLMERGGIARALIEFAECVVGHRRGGLALTCIAATTIFSAISGSSVATALAMATVLVPVMLERGYPRPFAVGVVGSAGTLGILIPPSLALVVYGLVAEASIPRLFLAGVVPGLLQALLFGLFIVFYARRSNMAVTEQKSLGETVRAFTRAVPALIIPVLIFVGIYGGYTTIAEAAALAAFLSAVTSISVYRGCKLSESVPIIAEALQRSAAIIVIVMAALLFGHWLTETGMPARLVELVTSIDLKAWQFLLLMNVVMLVMGMVLEGIAIILITVPLVLPLLQQFEIDLVHYAIIVVLNIELAMLAPPIGLNLYVLSGISKAPVAEVVKGVFPFFLLMLLLLVLVTYLPVLSVGLPSYFFGS